MELTRQCSPADRKTKAAIINQVTRLTGYNRFYTTPLLRVSNRHVLLPQAASPHLVLTRRSTGLRQD